MSDKKISNVYDDDNIPDVDLPHGIPQKNSQNNSQNSSQNNSQNSSQNTSRNSANANADGIVEPLPESSRPRKDGPGGE